MNSLIVQNVRFYKPKPYAIYSMSLNKDKNILAVGRSDASIEFWNLSGALFIEKRIPPIVDNNSIEELCWCGDRIFSVSLNGFLYEYDILNLTIKSKSAVTGEAAYCLDANNANSHLAIGTEQGYINIFSVNDEVLFERFLDKQEGKILCLKFFPNDQYIASGSIDAIRIWNVISGQAIHRVTTGRSEAFKETIIWGLAVTSDDIVISGDSRGRITFWDGKIGAQIESFQSHKADVLSVCLSQDEKTLYCAGVDPIIISYDKVNVKGTSQKWVKSIQRKVHEHDVRCLVLCENKLYSSGIDGYLACSYHPPKTLHKFPPILPTSCVSLSLEKSLILLQYSTDLELWKLGDVSNSKEKQGAAVKVNSPPKKLLHLFRTVKDSDGNEKKEGIICSSVSNDGKWIVFSTDSAVRLFSVSYEKKIPSVTPCDIVTKNYSVSLKATFSKDSRTLILACRLGVLEILNLNTNFTSQSIELGKFLKDTVSFLEISNCDNYLVVGDCQSNIVLFSKVIKKSGEFWELHCKLPKYSAPSTAIAINPHKKSVFMVYSDQKIIEYSINSRKISKLSDVFDEKVSNKWFNKWSAIKNIIFDPKIPDVCVFYDDNNIIVARNKKQNSEPNNKIPKFDAKSIKNEDISKTITVKNLSKYKHLVFMNWLRENEVVVVEVRPLSLIEQLPPCLNQNLFGTK